MERKETKTCQNCKNEFIIEPEDFAFYDKMQVPSPTFCPFCRAQRRMAFYNQRTLYKRPDSRTGKDIFSSFAPDAPVIVYDHDFWWSDGWDPMEYGREYDFSHSFFEQFREFLHTVPLCSRSILSFINSDYCNNAGFLKNCYLMFDAMESENVLYANTSYFTRDSIDVGYTEKLESAYEVFMSNESSRIFFSQQCDSSTDIYFSKNLRGCMSCFGCVNLRNKQYHIFNEPHTPEEYRKILESFDLGSYAALQEIKRKSEEFLLKFPVRSATTSRGENVRGEYITNSRNVLDSYNIVGGEDLRYCQGMMSPAKDSYDYTTWGLNAERVYECSDCGRGIANMKFCYDCWPDSHDIEYSVQCHSSSYLFGCIGLQKKSYCIFNKQYTKEEYFALVGKIREQMKELLYLDSKGREYGYGEYFPIEFSPFPYNDTVAQEYFPLTKEGAAEAKYRWRELAEKNYAPTKSWKELSDHIRDGDDTITQDTILCRAWDECPEKALEHNCTKVFRITPDELAFHKRWNIALPRKCPNSRHFERIQQRNPIQLWHRKCQCAGVQSENGVYKNQAEHFHGEGHCQNEFETSYTPTAGAFSLHKVQ